MHHTTIIFNSSFDAAERCTGEIIQAKLGGKLNVVDVRKTLMPVASNPIVRVRPEKLEDLYCDIASTQAACTVQVTADCTDAVLRFMEQYPGTAAEFGAVVLSTTRNEESQKKLIDTFAAMVRLGMKTSAARFLLVQAPREQPPEIAFSTLFEYLESPDVQAVVPPAVLYESVAFAKIHDQALSVSAMLNSEINFQTLLDAARQRNENEDVLRDLSKKLLVQRALLACRNDIERATDALQLPGDAAPMREPLPRERLAVPEKDAAVCFAPDVIPVY
ncbi:hypothetical protein [Paraburkholderia caledonica]|uniref:hypothetical protein n=1 Tax=Paraburkholderia caledonica TaxID=134536 RepID=UPI00036BE877|nr:hypothetical protein [Paraburkholderia caledonica]